MKLLFFVTLNILLINIFEGKKLIYPPPPHPGDLTPFEPKVYTLNLDLSPSERWTHIIQDYKVPLKKYVHDVIDKLPLSDKFYEDLGEYATRQFTLFFFRDLLQEIQGIAKVLEVDWRKIMLMNFGFEIACVQASSTSTSILAFDKDFTTIQGHNLNSKEFNLLSKFTAKIEVYQDGVLVNTWVQQIGTVYVTSGMDHRNNGTISVNTRYYAPGFNGIINNFTINGYYPIGFYVRSQLLTNSSYILMAQSLRNSYTLCGAIISIGGNSYGQIFQKTPSQSYHYTEMSKFDPDSPWYLVITNFAIEEIDPLEDGRRQQAMDILDSIGQDNITPQIIYSQVLTQYPNLNEETIYTAMYQQDVDQVTVSIWYDNNFQNQYLRRAKQ